jgi:4-hydroxy-tetrahydrodipicolinate reductase
VSPSQLRLGLLGSTGRMGKEVRSLLEADFATQIQLVGAPGRLDPTASLFHCDVVLDFALPDACIEVVRALLAHPKGDPIPALVVGSTGWNPEGEKLLHELSTRTPVLKATNFSIGVLAVGRILQEYGPLLKDLGYTPVLVEAHHRHKKDAPSGTALTLQNCIDPAHPESVQTHAIRAGEVIGDHEVTFHGPADKIVLGHFAQSRTLFARGALEAVLWLNELRKSGASGRILTMNDWFTARQVSSSA